MLVIASHGREATAETFESILGVTMANLTAMSVLF